MGDHLHIPKPLSPWPPPPPPPPLPPPPRSTLPILYYGVVVVATAAVVLAVYNLIVVRWCATQYRRSRQESELFGRRRNVSQPSQPPLSHGVATVTLVSSFRYNKKGVEGLDTDKNQLDDDTECSVCLSVFEQGEEVRRLPRCNHSFHASCIDMWLYSHFDCPLCRAPVVEQAAPPPPPALHRHMESEHSRDGLLDPASSSV